MRVLDGARCFLLSLITYCLIWITYCLIWKVLRSAAVSLCRLTADPLLAESLALDPDLYLLMEVTPALQRPPCPYNHVVAHAIVGCIRIK